MISHGNVGRAFVVGGKAVSAPTTQFDLVKGLSSFLVLLASLLVVGEVSLSVLLVLRMMTPNPIFTVGGSADKFDKECEGLNTAFPCPSLTRTLP